MTNRTIWLTPEVERFLTICASTSLASSLYTDMHQVATGEKGSDGFIRISVPPFLSYVDNNVAIYWHGPTDGAFYRPHFFARALPISCCLKVC